MKRSYRRSRRRNNHFGVWTDRYDHQHPDMEVGDNWEKGSLGWKCSMDFFGTGKAQTQFQIDVIQAFVLCAPQFKNCRTQEVVNLLKSLNRALVPLCRSEKAAMDAGPTYLLRLKTIILELLENMRWMAEMSREQEGYHLYPPILPPSDSYYGPY